MRRPSGPANTLRLGVGADAHEHVGLELHALAVDLDPAGAFEREEDLLLTALGVVVQRIVLVVWAASGSPACQTT